MVYSHLYSIPTHETELVADSIFPEAIKVNYEVLSVDSCLCASTSRESDRLCLFVPYISEYIRNIGML